MCAYFDVCMTEGEEGGRERARERGQTNEQVDRQRDRGVFFFF